MINTKARHTGFTLLETMLVLVIASSIIVLGIGQYQMYRVDANTQQVKYNVNLLFQAASNYYYAFCLDENKFSVQSASTIVTVPLSTLDDYYAESLMPNSLVNNSNYTVQFIRSSGARTKLIPVADNSGATTQRTVGTIIFWTIRVSARLNYSDPATVNGYRVYMGAKLNSGSTIYWDRLPLAATPDSTSLLWITNSRVNQFTRMYRMDPESYLLGLPKDGAEVKNRRYRCGG